MRLSLSSYSSTRDTWRRAGSRFLEEIKIKVKKEKAKKQVLPSSDPAERAEPLRNHGATRHRRVHRGGGVPRRACHPSLRRNTDAMGVLTKIRAVHGCEPLAHLPGRLAVTEMSAERRRAASRSVAVRVRPPIAREHGAGLDAARGERRRGVLLRAGEQQADEPAGPTRSSAPAPTSARSSRARAPTRWSPRRSTGTTRRSRVRPDGRGQEHTMEGFSYERATRSSAPRPRRARQLRRGLRARAAPDVSGGAGGEEDEARGVAPRAIGALFRAAAERLRGGGDGGDGAAPRASSLRVTASFVQVYSEMLLDLLAPGAEDGAWALSGGGVALGGGGGAASRSARARRRRRRRGRRRRRRLRRAAAALVARRGVLRRGAHARRVRRRARGARRVPPRRARQVMGAHRMNGASSRSHAVFTLHVEQTVRGRRRGTARGRGRRRGRRRRRRGARADGALAARARRPRGLGARRAHGRDGRDAASRSRSTSRSSRCARSSPRSPSAPRAPTRAGARTTSATTARAAARCRSCRTAARS